MTLDPARYGDLMLMLLPELVLTAWAMGLLVFVAWRHHRVRDLRAAGWLTLAGLAATAVAVWWLWWHSARLAPSGADSMIAVDDFRWVADWTFLGAAALTVFISFRYLEREQLLAPEYYVLLVFATLGMMLMAGGADLIVLFLGLELMSVAVYVLAGIDRRRARSAEAALKYFLLGAFASGFLLYGIALVYGATGTTGLHGIAARLTAAPDPGIMLLAGLALLLVGFAFKVAAVPFHTWAPDVYDGAPTPVTAFMATAVKAAAFAALFRVLLAAFAPLAAWRDILWWLALVTMIAGNLLALGQRSLKRMLAYSSVAHAGYLLVAVVAGGATGPAAFVVYLAAYVLMTIGAFALLAAKGQGGESDVLIDDLGGLADRRPWHAFALAVCMLSLLGFPGTAGFIGKWYILLAATGVGEHLLAATVVVTSVVSAGYYLPVIMAMYMKPEAAEAAHVDVRLGRLAGGAVAVVVAGLLVLGVWPNRLFELARAAGDSVRPAPALYQSPASAAAPLARPAAADSSTGR
ncbi:MAG: NADH-quinone oxidoreductase subunit N [Gemmatimonadales bacterium]